MKSKDILELVAAMAPAIDVHVDELIAPFRAQLKALEQHNESLRAETVRLQEHIKELQKIEVPTAKEIAGLVVVDVPTAQDVALLVPPGKDADPVAIKNMIDAAVAALPKPQDGKDVDIEFVKMLVDEAVEKLPPVEPGKDADPAVIKQMVDEAVANIPRIVQDADPAVIKAMVDEAVKALPLVVPVDLSPLTDQIQAIDKRVEAFRHALASSATIDEVRSVVTETYGTPEQFAARDHELISKMVDEAVAALPKPKDGESVSVEQLRPIIEKEIASQMMEIPTPKDGESVTVEQLAPLVAEQVNLKVAALPRAKDGVGMAGAVINRDGELIITMTDGTNTNLGNVLGKDGMGFEHLDVVDGEDEFVLKMQSGDRIREWTLRKPSVADHYKGVWAPGLHKRGALVTWGGSMWMAQRDTEVKPETKDNDDWKLVVKRGRDGKDFTPTGGK